MEFPNRVDPETLTVVSLITEEDTTYVLAVKVPLTVKFPLIVFGILNAKLDVATKLVTCVPEPLNISPELETCSKF